VPPFIIKKQLIMNVITHMTSAVKKFLTDSSGNIHVGRPKSAVEKYGMQGAMLLGTTRTDDGKDVPVFLDSLYPHVIFVCGARGSGKSYTLGVIVEGLAETNPNVGCIVVDPVGVFWSLKQANKQEGEKDLLKEWGLEPKGFGNVEVLIPKGARDSAPHETFDGVFSLKSSELTIDDWCLTFGLERFEPAGLLLERAIEKCGKEYSVDDLVRTVNEDEELTHPTKGFSSRTRRGISSRLDSSKSWGILAGAGEKATDVEALVKPGRVCVVDTSFLSEEVSCLVVGIIARKLLNARKEAARAESSGYKTNNVPPVWLCIDEAHTMIPNDRNTAASETITEYVKQGRRPGCSIVLATQQPSAVNSNVLSQLDMILVHKLVFHDDIKAVFKRMPSGVVDEMKDVEFVRTLPLGDALLGDREEENPSAFMVKIRPRKSQHEGRSSLAVGTKNLREMKRDYEEAPKGEEAAGETTTTSKKKMLWSFRLKPGNDNHDEALLAAKKMLKKKLLVLRDEDIEREKRILYPVWRARFEAGGKRVGFLYVDGLSGEITFGNDLSGRSRNIKAMEGLGEADRRLLGILPRSESNGMELPAICKKAGLDEKTASRRISELVKKGFVQSKSEKGGRTLYRIREKFAFMPAIDDVLRNNFAVQKAGEDTARIVNPQLGIEELKRIVALYEGASLLEADVVYRPLWVFWTNRKRRLVIDGLSGRNDEVAEGRIPKGI